MAESVTRHDGPTMHLDDGTPTEPPAQQEQQLIADELPMSEDDYALAIQSSRVLLQQINNRRHKSQYQRQYPRHRQQDTGRSVDRLAQGLHRQNLKQKDPLRHNKSPLRSCSNSRCVPATTVPKPSDARNVGTTFGRDLWKKSNEAPEDTGTSQAEGWTSLSPWKFSTQTDSSRPHLETTTTQPRSRANTMPMPERAPYNSYLRSPPRTTPRATPDVLLEADSDDDMDEDEGFFDDPDDLLRLGEETNEGMSSVGAYRRRGLLRFRRSSEAATGCPVVVRNVPRMRRRKQKKMEVRLRASTMSFGDTSNHATNIDPV